MKIIDAQNQKIGRVASEAAKSLMGKDTVTYKPNEVGGKVHITNASKLAITEKKTKEKEYAKYSGFPGGLRFETLEKIIKNKGHEEVLRRAIKRMLPSNRLRDLRLKNLKVTD